MNKSLKRISIIILTLFISFIGINNVYAESASISISSSTNKIVVGNTFKVYIKISSSSSLGSWEFTPSYDSSMLKLIDGDTTIVEAADNGSTKSASYTYKFKALKTGNATISVKSYGAYTWDETRLSINAGSKSISIITQAQLEASYSKNNYLKKLSVDGYDLSPEFDKETTEYTVETDSNVTSVEINATADDSKSSISGNGTHEVSEGENKFNVTVTAQNGSTKTYIVTVNVKDPNPIKVSINDIEYTVVKRESSLECPLNYEKITIEINEQTIPAFYNELNNFTLIGLKDNNSTIKLFLYNKDTNTYSEYNEVVFEQTKLFPLDIDKEFNDTYKKSTTNINGVTFNSLKINNSDYSIIHAKNILTGEEDYYLYDSKLNTVVRYTDENIKPLEKQIKTQKKLIIILGSETILVIIILIYMLIGKVKKNKKKKQYYEKELEKRNEKELEEDITNKDVDNTEIVKITEDNDDEIISEDIEEKKLANEEEIAKEVIEKNTKKEKESKKKKDKNKTTKRKK